MTRREYKERLEHSEAVIRNVVDYYNRKSELPMCYVLELHMALSTFDLDFYRDNIGISYFVDFIDEFEQALDIRKRLIDLTIIL